MDHPNVSPIGIFDSGYGGLTIAAEAIRQLSEYDFVYLGDNARAPYGSRSFEVVYKFTLQAVEKLFDMGCPLVILACNTASAKALRTIQQKYLPTSADPSRRVLGIIRPTVEALGEITGTRHVGILGTEGTVLSESYPTEIAKLYPDIRVTQEACPIWVPLVECGESEAPGTDYFVRKHLDRLLSNPDDRIDTIVLACTHYPLLLPKLRRLLTPSMKVLAQGEYVAQSLKNYLVRHPEMDSRLSKHGIVRYYTTEQAERFAKTASIFLDREVNAQTITIDE